MLVLSGPEIGIMGLIALLSSLAAGVEVLVALGGAGIVGFVALVSLHALPVSYATVIQDTLRHFDLSIVAFLFMGQLAMQGGLADEFFEAMVKWFGGFRSGLPISAMMAAATLGPGTGSSVATNDAVTRLALPELLKRGYDKRLASAAVATGGVGAMLLPPSALLVLYGILTGQKVAGLLVAGLVSGLMLVALFCITTIVLVRRRPGVAPVAAHSGLREKLRSLRFAGPLLLVVVGIALGLALGFLTPLVAGAVGAAAFAVIVLLRRLTLFKSGLRAMLADVGRNMAYSLALVFAALIFDRFVVFSGVPAAVQNTLVYLTADRWLIAAVVAAFYLLVGAALEAPVLLAVALPITYPVMIRMGFGSVWFGVFSVVLIELGAILPPVGRNGHVLQGAAQGTVRSDDVFNGISPYMPAAFAAVVLLCLFPEIATFLPRTAF